MSSDYTNFTKIAFDTLFGRGPNGEEIQVMDANGNLTVSGITSTGTISVTTLNVSGNADVEGSVTAGSLSSTSTISVATDATVGGDLTADSLTVGTDATVGGDLTVTGSMSASNFSGSSSGDNTGDVTIGTANGLSLANQELSMGVASSSAIGAVDLSAQTFAGDKTFLGAIAASNFSGSHSGTSSGTNTGDVTIGTANGLSLVGQALSLAEAGAAQAGAVSTSAQTIAGLKNFSNGAVIQGITDASSAALGVVGEYLESTVISATNTGATGAYFDATSLSLTAGDWDVTGIIYYTRNSATMSSLDTICGISTTSGNSASGLVAGVNVIEQNHGPTNPPSAWGQWALSIPNYRVNIASTTTYYLKGLIAAFSVGTPQYTCRLSARRVR